MGRSSQRGDPTKSTRNPRKTTAADRARRMVWKARQAYAEKLIAQGKALPDMTHKALEKQWKEMEQMEDKASHSCSDENPSDLDSCEEETSSDFEPYSGENDRSDGDQASGESDASMVSASDDAFDVENAGASGSTIIGPEVLESEIQDFTPNDLQKSTPEEIEAQQAELMGENISTGDSGGFLDGFPRRWHGWDAFHAAFDRFCEETYQRFPGRSSTSVGARNKQIKNNKKKIGAPVIPELWRQYTKTLVCTHGYKYTPRGSGERQHTLVRYVGCTARINVRVTWNGSWYLFVEPKGFHNHRCSKALWSYYAENRRITDPAVLGDVAEMRNAGANARGILGYLRKRTVKPCTLRDVHNILQALKRERNNDIPDVDRVEAVLNEYCGDAEGNSAEIFVDSSTNVVQAVVFQLAKMKRLFRAFPEVLLVDTTHGTNQNRYKLFSFVVHDVFGKGQYVQHALILNETKPLLRCAVDSFKRNCPEWQNVKVVISDKAFHEKDVMLEAFPGARQLLCLFHVQKWLHEQVGSRVVASIAVKNAIKGSLSALIYSKSEEDYLTQRSALLHHLGGSSKNEFYQFFLRNWDDCKEQWTMYLRGDVPHLFNHTNNRIEAKWGSMKKVIKKSFAIDELISMLLTLQEWAEEEYIGEINRVGSRPQIEGEDHELADLALHVSNHAFNYVKAEYSYAVGGSAHYSVNITESGQAQLKHPSSAEVYEVCTTKYSCTCAFAQTLLLPCRHILYFRLHNGNESVIPPLSFLSSRWKLRSPVNDISVGEVEGGGYYKRNFDGGFAPISERAKYSKTRLLMDQIQDLMAEQSTPTYKVALEWLECFRSNLQEGRIASFVELHTEAGLRQLPPTDQSKPASRVQVKSLSTTTTKKDDTSSNQKTKDGTTDDVRELKFAPPPKTLGLSRKQKARVSRKLNLVKARKIANRLKSKKKQFCVSLDDVVHILDGPYNYGSQQLVEALNLQNVDPTGKLRVRKGDLGPTTSQINGLVCRTKLEEAKAALLAGSCSSGLLAQWDNFGPVTLDQLRAMIRIQDATATFRDVELTTAWISNLQWPTTCVMAPFGDIVSTTKDEHKCKVEDVNLGDTFLEGEIFEGTKLLQWREKQWLNTTCITAALMALRERYWGVGVINPCYARFVQDKTKKQVAASFGAFRNNKDHIVGCINLTDAHWVAFHINPRTRLVRMFDPQQSQAQYAQIKNSVLTAIEPLLHEGGPLTFECIDWCVQRDGHSCGVWSIVVLELLLSGQGWDDSLYELVPFLRLRYLCMSVDLIKGAYSDDEDSDGCQ